MVFNSFSFLAFFPIVTLLYFALPKRMQPVWLLLASYYFYMSWNAEYALLIALSTVITYGCARMMEKLESRFIQRVVMLLGLGTNLAILLWFKYYGFFGDMINRMLGGLGIAVRAPEFDILLPVGISFYTFQALGYMLDVYRGTIRAERNLLNYALFVSFFPQLVAGPIERSGNLLRQVSQEHRWNASRAFDGLLIMTLGYFEKLVIADRASLYVDSVYAQWHAASGWQIVLATAAFAFQIYGDFGGYSHIAIGAAKILGFDLMDNFRQPYFAVSVRDFWRRWHISLSTWFRDYLYIPMGGSRVSKARRAFNTMVTFVVSGLWHGASMNYVAWGALNGALQVAEGWLPGKTDRGGRAGRAARILLTFLIICFTWLFFRVNALSTGLRMLGRVVLHFFAAPVHTGFSGWQAGVLLLGIMVLLVIDLLHECGVSLRAQARRIHPALAGALLMGAMYAILILGMWGAVRSQQAFIYFQF